MATARDTVTASSDAVSGVPAHPVSLVGLLGEQRASLVEHLRGEGELTVAQAAAHLGISEVATRRHLGVLEDEQLITSRSVNPGRGRPVAHYQLTDKARGLFPQRYAAVASELLDFISDEHGRDGLRTYLRWRLERETDQLANAVTAEDLHDRLDQLAGALSAAGFSATVTEDGAGFQLRQDHCAIYDVAKHHPEMCTYEAATFSKVLGSDVRLSRRQTKAAGGSECVCTVTARGAHPEPDQT